MSRNDPNPARLFAHTEADRCVACGLCLPYCPTYRLARTENESPRGRISLIQGLATGQLAPDQAVAAHLDRCTYCLACESACPAGVEFGNLMTRARGWLTENGYRKPDRPIQWLLSAIRSGQHRLDRLARAGRRWQANPVRRLLQKTGVLGNNTIGQLDRHLPGFADTESLVGEYPAMGTMRGTVSLFTGCLQRQTDPGTLTAAIALLTRLGYRVLVPEGQACCGSLHLHSGDRAGAVELAHTNLAAFHPEHPVIGVATGCELLLKDYGSLLGQKGAALSGRFFDINEFLLSLDWPDSVRFEPLEAQVAVHEPCSQRNRLRQGETSYRLLERIPGLEVLPLAGNESCCGGAGSYPLEQPELADRMRSAKLAALQDQSPDYLVTSNLGCALHLKAGTDEVRTAEVLHPITLMARQLGPATDSPDTACTRPGDSAKVTRHGT